jgi:hypothetical protein
MNQTRQQQCRIEAKLKLITLRIVVLSCFIKRRMYLKGETYCVSFGDFTLLVINGDATKVFTNRILLFYTLKKFLKNVTKQEQRNFTFSLIFIQHNFYTFFNFYSD